jgi:ketosteroid isomerase-like protein
MANPHPVKAQDSYAIQDLLARYCWFFDEGDADGYASLWTDDGELTGFGDPVRGLPALRKLLERSYADSKGKLRHVLTALTMSYGRDPDSVTAKGYNVVIRWESGGQLLFNVKETFELRRTDTGWRLTHVHLDIMQ